MIDFTHVHLFLNHLPVVGIPFTLLVYIVGLVTKDEKIIKLGLSLFIFVALIAIPVYLTGEPAEDAVSMLPGVEKLIEPHEEAGLVSLVLSIICGIISIVILFFTDKLKIPKPLLMKVLLAFAVSCTLSLSYTAFKGGQIRHSEIRSE